MSRFSIGTRFYVAVTVVLSLVFICIGFSAWRTEHIARFLIYAAAAFLASRLRVTLPGITGTMSVNFIFTLVGIVDLNLGQLLVVTWSGIVGQVIPRRKAWNGTQVLFNLASITVSATAAYGVYHFKLLRSVDGNIAILLLLCSATLFLVNTFSVSGIIALTEGKNVWRVWRDSFWWTGSHYLVGACLAGVFHAEERLLGWEAVLLTAPAIYLVYRSYSLYLSKLDAAKSHAAEIGNLHWRAIEALALAIDAKDETTHNHLLRVRVYATEIGKELNLSEEEMDALKAASLLHDIGKLAVPEQIISKPGKLTPDEFEKMKIHPVVGAEILERVQFPYPVVPIVRAHHEKWNGKGYPFGLKGEEIPIGARIISAVDCLDALASNRQYRRALPLRKAMEIVTAESGVSFDPRIVEILQRRYVELEHKARSIPEESESKLSKNVRFARGGAPGAGFETAGKGDEGCERVDFMVSISAARHEFHNLFRLTEELGTSLGVNEISSLLAARLKPMAPHDTIVIYAVENQRLIPKYVSGEDCQCFASLEIPVGEGLSGWVVRNNSPIVNGNPSVESSYMNDAGTTRLQSALSVPLEAAGEIIGALSLYSLRLDYYTREHLRILQSIAPRAALAIGHALRHESLAISAVTDELTGLPNARSLFIRLQAEVERAQHEHLPVAVAVIDINGFKQINDNFGHLAGNRLLKCVAEELRKACRDVDFISRLGGDEFVVIMPGLDPSSLTTAVRLLNSAVALANDQPCALSSSLGVSFYPKDGETAESLLEMADSRMYDAKRHHYRFTAPPEPGVNVFTGYASDVEEPLRRLNESLAKA